MSANTVARRENMMVAGGDLASKKEFGLFALEEEQV